MPKAQKKSLSQEEILARSKAKADKFRELAVKRVRRAIHAIHGIGNLSATGSYTYTQEQVSKIFTSLTDALKSAAERYQGGPAKGGFEL